MKKLIINADDFGLSKVFNESILLLLNHWQITSTTVMVNRISDSQSDQVSQLKDLIEKRKVSIGLHTEFTYDQHEKQIKDQFEKFVRIFEIQPDHLDIHKEHLHTGYHHLVADFCKSRGIPFRNHGNGFEGLKTTDKKYFFGSTPDFSAIDQWLKELRDNEVNELVFHPGRYDPDCPSSLNRDREIDIDHIVRINDHLGDYNIDLVSFLILH